MDPQHQLFSRLNPLVNSDEWKDVQEYIDIQLESLTQALISARDWESVKEIQGKIRAYQDVRSLPSSVLKHKLNSK